MPDFNVILPSQPRVISEDEFTGVYEVEGLYPGYGHTLGNSLRRIILSSLPGYAVTAIKIEGVNHEFSTIEGVKQDVITILLNLKKVRFRVIGDEPQVATVDAVGPGEVTAKDLKLPGNVEVVDPDQKIADLADKQSKLKMELKLEKGLGYVPKELLQQDKMDVGIIATDATFTPIRRVSYEVEHMRVGNRTDFNRLRIALETNGEITPKEALTRSIDIMISQLKAIVGFKENEQESEVDQVIEDSEADKEKEKKDKERAEEALKTRVEDMDLSPRTLKSLQAASIRTAGGLARKKETDLLALSGLGEKGVQEIKRALSNLGIVLK